MSVTGSVVGVRGRPGGLVVVLVLVLSACGGAGDPEGVAPTGGSSTTVPGGSVSAEEWWASLPVFEGTPDELLAEGQRLIRQQLVDELGLAEVLTPEVFTAGDLLISKAFEEEFPELVPDASSGVTGVGSVAVLVAAPRIVSLLQKAPALSGLYTAPSWASSALSGLWYDAKTTSGEVSVEPHSDTGKKEIEGGITATIEASYSRQGRQLVAEVTYTVTYTVDGVAYTEITHVNVTADACPDADGVLKISYDLDYSLTGGKTATRTVSGTATAHVGDDATLQSIDHNTEFDNGSGSPVRVGYSRPATTTPSTPSMVPGQDDVSFTTGEATFTSASGLEGKSDVELFEAGLMTFLITESFVKQVVKHAQSAWWNGGCVFIVVPEGTDHKLKAKESFTFTARVDHKFEGGDVPVPVNGELSSGDGTLVPGRIDPAPDTFVMTAGVGLYDNVDLETVSRRGRDTETVHFDVEAAKITAAFTGTFDYDMQPLSVHGDVDIPAITLTADFDGVFTGTGPVGLALTAEVPGCGTATGSQEGGEITLTAKLQTRADNEVLTFLAEESEGGEIIMSCAPAGAIMSGGFGAGGAGLINLAHIAIPLEEGTYQFQNDDTTAGVHFVVQGELTLTIPSS